jgi:hypothetical protein
MTMATANGCLEIWWFSESLRPNCIAPVVSDLHLADSSACRPPQELERIPRSAKSLNLFRSVFQMPI